MSWPEEIDESYFDKYNHIINKYLPEKGQGDSFATQVVTAVYTLIHDWYWDGNVYDNRHTRFLGYGKGLASYGNWLSKYTICTGILNRIYVCRSYGEYSYILKDLARVLLNEEYLEKMCHEPIKDNIYTCKGKFKFYYDNWSEEEKRKCGAYDGD